VDVAPLNPPKPTTQLLLLLEFQLRFVFSLL
jgi:hypothetical protein